MEFTNEYHTFQNPTVGTVSLQKLIAEIKAFVEGDPQSEYRVIIGTDSSTHQVKQKKEADFVTAVVVHRAGFGGRYFWHRLRKARLYGLREKIYTETTLSLNLAQILVPRLRGELNHGQKYSLEIHIDVGEVGATRDMIKEVVGMVLGNGFEVKTKPDSYAAFVVADKYTKNKLRQAGS